MTKTCRPWNRDQTLLFPPSPVDWLSENHLMFFLLNLVAELDLQEIRAHQRRKEAGLVSLDHES